jgi:hypothetical protein
MLAALVDLPCWPPQDLRDEGGYPLASAGLSRGRPGAPTGRDTRAPLVTHHLRGQSWDHPGARSPEGMDVS